MNKTLQSLKPKFIRLLSHKHSVQNNLNFSKSSIPMSTCTSTNTNIQDVKYNMIISDLQDLKIETNTLKTMNFLLLTFNLTFYLEKFVFPFLFSK